MNKTTYKSYKNAVKSVRYLSSTGYLTPLDAESLIKDYTTLYISQLVEGQVIGSLEHSLRKSFRSIKKWILA